MAKTHFKKGASLYNYILHEATVYNNSLPEDRKLSLATRRKIVSGVLYPQFRDMRVRDLRVGAIRDAVEKKLKPAPADPTCDVNFLPSKAYDEVSYFAIDNFIKEILPPCIFVRVNAGTYGVTNIFNTREYDYTRSGVQDIVEEIREDFGSEFYEQCFFSGYVKLRHGKAHNGAPENYFLDMILIVEGRPVDDTTEQRYKHEKTEKIKKKQRLVSAIMDEKAKNVKRRKARTKTVAKTVTKTVARLKQLQQNINKSTKKKPANIEKFKTELKAGKKAVEKSYQKGDLTHYMYAKHMKTLTGLKLKKKKK